ncbi:MAG: Ppx/GppA family phosphatase [Pseudomonadota bacterium]|nr:Ppx/GppA family phosphatase [Pseudomonadota bacterium]
MDATRDSQSRASGKRRRWPSSRHHGIRAPQLADSVAVYGALDLGTNNCRLLLAQPGTSGFAVVDAFSRIVRLGEGASRTGRLDEQAMRRTIDALRVCANKLIWRKVKRRRLVATEACRVAENGLEFIERVKSETGLGLEVIDRQTEAELAVAGAAPLIEDGADKILVFDIGGGSTEIVWLEREADQRAIRDWISLPAGVVTVAEMFGGVEVTRESYAAMCNHVRELLAPFRARIADRQGSLPAPDHLLGTSGTVTTIAGVQLGLARYDRSRVDGSWLAAREIAEVTAKLLAMSYAERAASPCIGPDRADLVLAGCAILEEICRAFPADRLRVADRGLREGILTSLMQEDGTYGRADAVQP